MLFFSSHVSGQDSLLYLDFLQQVKDYHPYAQKARLLVKQSDLVVRQARGGFDPLLSAKLKEKNKTDFYYQQFGADLSIPTISGITFNAGFDQNSGFNSIFQPTKGYLLNPENYTTSSGTGYLGVSVPLGKGLFIDENRLALRGAQQIGKQLLAESNLQLNDLYFYASEAFWDWFSAFQMNRNLDSSIILAQERFNMVRQEFFLGESSGADTLKAYVQWRDRKIEQLEVQRQMSMAYFELRKWIWKPEWMDKVVFYPNSGSMGQLQFLSGVWSVTNNPKLAQIDAKLMEQKFERRFKIEKIKPKLTFDYDLLYSGYIPKFDNVSDNQLWGIGFQYPLFTRAERNALKLTNIKIENLKFDQNYIAKELDLKLQNEIKQIELLDNQVYQLSSLVLDYSQLLSYESLKFRMGDSNLFELNAWELKLLEGQNKLVKSQAKKAITQAKLMWYSNSWGGVLK